MTILVAEDNIANRDLIQEMLEAFGHDVVAVCDGQAALDALETHKPDFILLDIQMPRLDGFQTLTKMRENLSLAGIPIVALSAYAMEYERERALSHGFDAYLTKPIDMTELRMEMQRLMPMKDPQP